MKLAINSTSSKHTEQIAAKIGRNLEGGEVIELISDLGGGKTVFVRGLVAGTDSKDQVASPTFTISKIYSCPKFAIHHFDFYRLDDPGIVALELQEVLNDPKIVVIIEWAEIVRNVLPKKRLTLQIEHSEGNARQLNFSYPKDLNYLMAGLVK